jgi:tetratricopeptide (TPR) repeat protein
MALLPLATIAAPAPNLPSSTAPKPTPSPSPTTPRSPQPDKFPPSPLEFTEPDPLLPGGRIDPQRPLTAAEQQTLTVALDALNATAAAQNADGRPIEAFNTWNRELRLRRALGPLAEITALGRVGDIAWRQTQPEEVQVITKRLQTLQTQIAAPSGQSLSNRRPLLIALGTAYQQVRSPQLALTVYQPMLAEARQQKNAADIFGLLNTIGQLQLTWFKYEQAAPVYQELLAMVQGVGDVPNTIGYLTQLAYLHEQAKQPAQALSYQQQLLNLYQQGQQILLLADLKIQMAKNYAAIGQLDEAEQTYQSAFTTAQTTRQLAYATEALRQLGQLYRQNDRLDAALQVYEFLVGLEQQAYSRYGMMDAYDQLGQLHLVRKAYPEAIAAFQKGLGLAQEINYRTDYFSQKIQAASQQEKP